MECASPTAHNLVRGGFYGGVPPGSALCVPTTTQVAGLCFHGGADVGPEPPFRVHISSVTEHRHGPCRRNSERQDIVITRETWYSADLTLVLSITQEDPRFEQTTYSLKDIQRGKPDPTLFQVPAGYRIEREPVDVHSR